MSAAAPTIDPKVAGCQPLLISPPAFDPATFAGQLDTTLEAGGVAGLLLRLGDPEPDRLRAATEAVRPVCARRGIALLLATTSAEQALALGVDGVQVAGAEVAAARSVLGGERLVGGSCGHSRHDAMTAGESGADYVAFGHPDQPVGAIDFDLIAWWSDVFVIPCLADVTASASDLQALARGGADFVAAGDLVWACPDGPTAGLQAIRALISR